jgi:hypothetical protein
MNELKIFKLNTLPEGPLEPNAFYLIANVYNGAETNKPISKFYLTNSAGVARPVSDADVIAEISTKLINEKSLILDQTIPQTVDNGTPIFKKGINAEVVQFKTDSVPAEFIENNHINVYAKSNKRLYRRISPTKEIDVASGGIPYTINVASEGTEFSTLQEVITHLETNQLLYSNGVQILLDGGDYDISDTIHINLPFPLMIDGRSSNLVRFNAATGLEGKPMFEVDSETYFRSVTFDGSTLVDWKLNSNAAIIVSHISDIYCEVTDFVMIGGNSGIKVTTNTDLFVFNYIIEDCVSGINFYSIDTGGSIDCEVGNFTNCDTGINLLQGTNVDVFLSDLRFLHTEVTQIGINYVGTNFTYSNFVISAGDFSGIGTLLQGFDFTLERDANIVIRNLVGVGDKQPKFACHISDSTLTTTCTTQNQWYILNTGTLINGAIKSQIKFQVINENMITYLPTRIVDLLINIAINLSASGNNRNIEIGLARWRENEQTGTVLAGFANRFPTGGQPGIINLPYLVTDVLTKDSYALAIRCTNAAGITVTLNDLSIIFIPH